MLPWLALREEQKGKEGGRREGGRREARVVAVDAVTLPEPRSGPSGAEGEP